MNLLDNLLQKTSRTFALSIPLLPTQLQRSVSVAYLLFRIADTIEDEFQGSFEERALALHVVADRFAENPRALADVLLELHELVSLLPDGGYAELLASAPEVIEAFGSLPASEQRVISMHLARTCRGMAQHLGRDLSNGRIEDLQKYCYIVAGIVGEMLTELFVLHNTSLARVKSVLLRDATAFGEGLQLVNIIRDAADDLHDGRCYLPRSIDRTRLIKLASKNLDIADGYIRTLQQYGASPGVVRFNALNLSLAYATIDAVQEHGPGAKVSRERVDEILSGIVATGDSRTCLDTTG